MYSTHLARGTECYPAPELVKEASVVTMKSDIFALGCIIYELVFEKKAFVSDYDVFEYSFHKCKLDIPPLPEHIDERQRSYVTQILHAALEINWWKRPAARDLVKVFCLLLKKKTKVYVMSAELGVFYHWIRLHPFDEN